MAGREGKVPTWPLTGALAHIHLPLDIASIEDDAKRDRIIEEAEAVASATFARELELWATEWRRPQATEWERNGQQIEVALYVRALVAAEAPDAKVTLRALVKQQQEALGLSLPGLARNRWVIGAASDEDAPRPTARRGRSARDRFRVVNGGAVGDA